MKQRQIQRNTSELTKNKAMMPKDQSGSYNRNILYSTEKTGLQRDLICFTRSLEFLYHLFFAHLKRNFDLELNC